jgi:hypothetical protein
LGTYVRGEPVVQPASDVRRPVVFLWDGNAPARVGARRSTWQPVRDQDGEAIPGLRRGAHGRSGDSHVSCGARAAFRSSPAWC